MKKYFLFSFIGIFCFYSTFSQEITDKEQSKLKIWELHIITGGISNQSLNTSLEDFRKLDSKSNLLQRDFSDYEKSTQYIGGQMFAIMLGMQFKNKKYESEYKMNPLLRAGISFYSSSPLSIKYSKEVSNTYDTLVSNNTGNTHYLDSVSTEFYEMNYQNDQIRLDLSVLFRTNTDSRWSLFAGLGLNTGISLQSKTMVTKNMYGSEQIRSDDGKTAHLQQYNNFRSEQSSSDNKTNFAASVYVPLGVDFKIARHSDIWSKIHLMYELRPAINFTIIPELQSHTYTSFQHGLGFKVVW